MANEQIQRYRIGRIAVGEAGQKAVALLPDPDGDAVKFFNYLAATNDLREGQMHLAMELERKDEQIRKLREALTKSTPLARRACWIAYVWNDHNFDDAYIEARRICEKYGIKSFDDANDYLASVDAALKAGE